MAYVLLVLLEKFIGEYFQYLRVSVHFLFCVLTTSKFLIFIILFYFFVLLFFPKNIFMYILNYQNQPKNFYSKNLNSLFHLQSSSGDNSYSNKSSI